MADSVAEHIAALRDEDWAIREEAAAALGLLKDPRAVHPLVSALRDSDRAVREAAVSALTEIGEPSVTVLVGCLADEDLTVQEAASAILAKIGDVRAVEPLIVSLRNRDWIVRMHAAKALGRIREPVALDSLVPLLRDKVKAVREEAAVALVAIGQSSLPVLLKALSHDEWLVRLHAVEALGKLKSPEAVEPLLSLLFNDSDSAVREDVVRALGEIGDTRATEFLFMAVKDPALRTLAVEALGRIGDRRAVPVLVEIAKGTHRPAEARPIAGCADGWNEEMVTMGTAVRALGMIGDTSTVPTLVEALRNTVTRVEASAALIRFGPSVIPYLLPVLARETDDNIRYHIKETLTQLGWRPGRTA